MDEPNLQPLRITSGWNVEWNLFYEVDPSEKTLTYLDSSSLLHLNNSVLMRAINLDFRPENDVNECFYLRVVNNFDPCIVLLAAIPQQNPEPQQLKVKNRFNDELIFTDLCGKSE